MAVSSEYFCKKMFSKMFIASGLSGLALAASNVIDAICVGGAVGETGLAAVGIVSPIYILYNVLGYGFSIGGSVEFAKLTGKGEEKKAVSHFNEMMTLLMAISCAAALLGSIFCGSIVRLLGGGGSSEELFVMCRDYAGILIAALPVFMINFMFNDFLRCDDNQYLATAAFIAGSAVDFVLNIILVIVLGFGVKGSAAATVTGQTVSILISLPHFFSGNHILKLRPVKPDLKRCAASFRVGVATSIDSLFVFVFLLTANRLLMHSADIDSELYVAVFDVVMNISYITNSMFLASGETLRPLASTFFAEHNMSQAKYALRLSILWGYICNCAVIAAIAIFADKFSVLFGIDSADSLFVSVAAVRIFCIGALISGIPIIYSSYCQSVDRETLAFRITMLRSFIFLIPITAATIIMDADYFWYAIPAAEMLTLLVIILGLLRRDRKTEEDRFCSYMLCKPENLGEALQKTEEFCEQQGMGMKQTNMVIMFIEETCDAIMRNAFTGKKDEYIQLTVAVEGEDSYALYVRDSAVSFNLFDMKTGKLSDSDDDSLVDSVGILMMKNKAKDFYYRRYQGFNMLTIKF